MLSSKLRLDSTISLFLMMTKHEHKTYTNCHYVRIAILPRIAPPFFCNTFLPLFVNPSKRVAYNSLHEGQIITNIIEVQACIYTLISFKPVHWIYVQQNHLIPAYTLRYLKHNVIYSESSNAFITQTINHKFKTYYKS